MTRWESECVVCVQMTQERQERVQEVVQLAEAADEVAEESKKSGKAALQRARDAAAAFAAANASLENAQLSLAKSMPARTLGRSMRRLEPTLSSVLSHTPENPELPESGQVESDVHGGPQGVRKNALDSELDTALVSGLGRLLQNLDRLEQLVSLNQELRSLQAQRMQQAALAYGQQENPHYHASAGLDPDLHDPQDVMHGACPLGPSFFSPLFAWHRVWRLVCACPAGCVNRAGCQLGTH